MRIRKQKKRAGFTLVELLVVMSIIAMLAGLLLPAVQSVREQGRRTTCMNNMRQVGLALTQEDTSSGALPGWSIPQTRNPPQGQNVPNPTSWVWAILDEMERSDIVGKFGEQGPAAYRGFFPNSAVSGGVQGEPNLPYTRNNAPKGFYLESFVCPNDTTAIGGGSETSYAVNCGMRDNAWDNTGPNGSATESTGNMELTASAVFHNQTAYLNNNSLREGMRLSLTTVNAGDGTSNTLLLSENIDATDWRFAGEGFNGICWVPIEDPTYTEFEMRINGGGIGSQAGQLPRPSSYHPGGVMAVFCDGHASFLEENMDYVTYALLFTPRGRDVTHRPNWNGNFGSGAELPPALYQIYGTTLLNEEI